MAARSWPSMVTASQLRDEISLGVSSLWVMLGHGVERDVVGIVDEDQVVEAVVAGEGDGLPGHAFLKAAVAVRAR